jgi:hypothetical protein
MIASVSERESDFFQKISTLPQPLSIFDWVSVIQTSSGVSRFFFNVFDNQLELEELPHAKDTFVENTKEHPLAQCYLQFAHHPTFAFLY